jgi:acyl carrier protein
MTTNNVLTLGEVSTAVKLMLIAESRSSVDPAELSDDEPLKGAVLNVSSLGFVGVLVRLEDQLGVDLPDNLFAERTFSIVRDIVDIVAEAANSH